MARPTYIGDGSSLKAGPYLRQTREACIKEIQPKTPFESRNNVTACVLQKFTELDKALYASRQYILTLWPAFVGAVVALAPDPASMVYDNLWWSALFCVTCGGLPGLDRGSSPPHHIEVHSECDGRAMCESWKYDTSKPKALAKSRTMGPTTSRRSGEITLEWISFFIGVALWVAFIVYFGHTLAGEGFDFAFSPAFLKGAVWYYISASPAVLAICFEVMQNRVDLYEPVKGATSIEEASMKGDTLTTTESVAANENPSQQFYQRVVVPSVFSLWLRVLLHQWRRSKYRILVRDPTSHRLWWFFAIGRALVGIGRITVFAMGSITMGNILLLPVPDDLYLFAILMFTTAVPRQLWPAFWTNGNRGADLVVFVQDLKLIGVTHPE